MTIPEFLFAKAVAATTEDQADVDKAFKEAFERDGEPIHTTTVRRRAAELLGRTDIRTEINAAVAQERARLGSIEAATVSLRLDLAKADLRLREELRLVCLKAIGVYDREFGKTGCKAVPQSFGKTLEVIAKVVGDIGDGGANISLVLPTEKDVRSLEERKSALMKQLGIGETECPALTRN